MRTDASAFLGGYRAGNSPAHRMPVWSKYLLVLLVGVTPFFVKQWWFSLSCLALAVIIDLFSRRVVGWSMSGTMTAQLVTDALIMAIWRRGKPDALLHHSDQGSQYTSEQFQRLMADHGVACSMSRSGNCWDNAAMESFFSLLQNNVLDRRSWGTREELRLAIVSWIEGKYHRKRRQRRLGKLTPSSSNSS